VRLTWEKIRRSLGIPDGDADMETGALGARPEGAWETGATDGVDPQAFVDDGVHVTPMPVTGGERVTVAYDGLLARQGAGRVYLHYGYGPGPWSVISDVPMEKVGDRFEATFEVAHDGLLEFCFRDDAGNWDNNNGRNWSCIIHDGQRTP